MRRFLLLLPLLWFTPRLFSQTDFPGVDAKWQYFQSPNFELYSRNREEESRELLHNLELLRAVFLDMFKLEERRRLEVTVYFFKSDRDFRAYVDRAYGTKHKFTGFYMDGSDRAVIYLIPGQDEVGTRELIFHEYVHHLFRVSEQKPPVWFNEGMAEMFSTLVAKGKNIELGHPSPGRLYQLKWDHFMPLEQLFAVDHTSTVFRDGEHTGLFYAESWALLHYLNFGVSGIAPEKRLLFMDLVLKGGIEDPQNLRTAFREVFGMDYPDMQVRLKRYVEGGTYSWMKRPLPNIPASASYLGRAVTEREIRLRLAELDLRVNRSGAARLALLQAAEQDPSDTRPLEALGADALRDQDQLTARERWTRAADAGTHNAAIYRELGLMESRAWFSHFDVYFRLPEENAQRLRAYLLRSIEYNPAQTDAYEMLAWVEAFAAKPSIKNLTLVQQKYPTMTRKERAALALAFVRVRLDKKDEALEMLAQLEKMRPDEWVIYGIEAIRAHVENRPIKRDNLRLSKPRKSERIDIKAPRIELPR